MKRNYMWKCYHIACSWALLLLILCGNSCTPDISDQSHWQTLELPPYGWTIKAPKGSYVKIGDNRHPISGFLYCDGFVLEFASATEEMGCSSDGMYAAYQEFIKRGRDTIYHGKFTPHYTYIDTIDNNIALIVAPVGVAGGNIRMNMLVCSTRDWINITGDGLTTDQVKLVKAMFETVHYTAE